MNQTELNELHLSELAAEVVACNAVLQSRNNDVTAAKDRRRAAYDELQAAQGAFDDAVVKFRQSIYSDKLKASL